MNLVPITCAGCKYAFTVAWYGSTTTTQHDHYQTRCDMKHREISLADKDCELKECRK